MSQVKPFFSPLYFLYLLFVRGGWLLGCRWILASVPRVTIGERNCSGAILAHRNLITHPCRVLKPVWQALCLKYMKPLGYLIWFIHLDKLFLWLFQKPTSLPVQQIKAHVNSTLLPCSSLYIHSRWETKQTIILHPLHL